MSSPCMGQEFLIDSMGAARIKTPRPQPYAYPLSQASAATALFKDANGGGLWVPQTPVVGGVQEQKATGQSISVAIGTPWNAPLAAWTPIANPSATFPALLTVDAEWQIHMSGHVYFAIGALSGGISLTGAAPSVYLASASASTNQAAANGDIWNWHRNVNHTVQMTLAPGQSVTPQVIYTATNVYDATFTTSVTPGPQTLHIWRVTLSWTLFLQYPAPIA